MPALPVRGDLPFEAVRLGARRAGGRDVGEPLDDVIGPEGLDVVELASLPVEDVDDDTFAFQLDLESSGIPDGVAVPTIDSSTGEFEWTPTETGEFEIRVIVVSEDGGANQETFVVRIVSED